MARPIRPKSTGSTNSRFSKTVPSQVSTVDEVTGDVRKRQNLEYISHMLRELRAIAISSEEKVLVYFLEMAALEAGEKADNIADCSNGS